MLVYRYLYACFRLRALPWNFFQLNGGYFNEAKGIFSKLEMDNHIPDRWRLEQHLFDRDVVPERFPVFLKPEWGQNSVGIVRIDNRSEYLAFAHHAGRTAMPYIVQQAATGRKEYEVYYLRSPELPNDFAILSITRTLNNREVRHPINSIHNPDTSYRDITPSFSARELRGIWGYLRTMGNFRMARVCLKADSKEDLLRGIFQVVEINLFLPMPLVLLAENVTAAKKGQLIGEIMTATARLVKNLPRNETGKSIFFRKMKAHYRNMR
jgi:hypothetical protein